MQVCNAKEIILPYNIRLAYHYMLTKFAIYDFSFINEQLKTIKQKTAFFIIIYSSLYITNSFLFLALLIKNLFLFKGLDATRAYVTGDFSEAGLTDDVDGLDDSSLAGIEDWLSFYREEYKPVGKIGLLIFQCC